MTQVFEKTYRYRFYPTEEQKRQLAHTFGCCRFVYNHFLELKNKAWLEEKKTLTYADCSKTLTDLKKEFPWLKEVSSVPLQQTLRHLEKAYQHFWNKTAGYPSFKNKHTMQSASFMKSAFTYEKGEIKLAKHKDALSIRWSRRFREEPTSLTITKDTSDRYHISIIVKETIEALPFKKKEIGLDLGLIHLFVDDQGHGVEASHFFQSKQKKLVRKQRTMARRVKGSKNRAKARKEVAKVHAKIRDRRQDSLHKLSRQIINENQVIAVESLDVKTMMQKNFGSSFADAGLSTLLWFLEYIPKQLQDLVFGKEKALGILRS